MRKVVLGLTAVQREHARRAISAANARAEPTFYNSTIATRAADERDTVNDILSACDYTPVEWCRNLLQR